MKFFLLLFLLHLATTAVFTQETGLNELVNIDKLPLLRNDIIYLQNSSHDPKGGNRDGFKEENGVPAQKNFYGYYNGENVMLHVKGKGIVKRIWLTGFDGRDANDWAQRIKFYFDGETTPRIDERVIDFFEKSHRSADYYPNLIAGYWESSMGSISYIPFPFEKEIIITTNADDYAPDATNYFNNVQYELYPEDANIVTWNGYDGLTEENNILANRGSDPRSNQTYLTQNNTFNLGIGETKTAISINEGNKNVTGLFVDIPDLKFSEKTFDTGRAHSNYSQFEMNIDPNADTIILRRRFDYGVGNQKADIYIGDVKAGTINTGGFDNIKRWRDVDFEIPKALIGSKTRITVKVKFISSDVDWNEFRYWTICDDDVVDEIDINNSTSETTHNYSSSGGWSGSLEASYGYGFSITDDGRAFTGHSQFTLNVNSAASEYKLVRRLNFGIANQKAKILVDGTEAGEWYTPGSAPEGNSWADSEFIIPANLVQGKDQITIKVEYLSGIPDWNEFYYWIYCDGAITDELDVMNTTSESAHSYTSTGGWSGTASYVYPGDVIKPVDDGTTKILEKVNIQVFYNGESIPAIDAPLGLFFGTGTFERVTFQSLPVGVEEGTSKLYCYFPMPFENSYEVKLVNNYGKELQGVNVSANYTEFTENFKNCGYLKTQYKIETPPVAGKDHIILEETGSGKYAGVIFEVRNSNNSLWLEGDERFYIDGSRTPQIQGTGLEDYFNGAWYFGHGPFNLAQHGFNAFVNEDRTLYRFHITDPINFSDGAILGMEHGPANDQFPDYHTLAFYYHNPESKMELTDELNISDAASESSHSYIVTGSKEEQFNKIYYFEGDNDNVTITESGNYIQGSSEFKVAVNAGKPVKIKRMFDYGLQDQEADVYVDDVKVGTWYSGYKNEFKRWREEFFYIPEKYTDGKSEITLKFIASSDSINWSEFHYWIYSVEPITSTSIDNTQKSNNIFVYPNPVSDFITINNNGMQIKKVDIYSLSGQMVMNLYSFNNMNTYNVAQLKPGTYIMQINTGRELISKKIIKK